MPTKAEVDTLAANLFRNNPSELRRYRQLVNKQETTNVNAKKAAKKSLRKSIQQVQARRSQDVLVKSVENAVLSRINELEHQLAKSSGGQDAWGIAFLLNRERSRIGRFAKGVPTMDDFKQVASYLGDMQDHPARAEAQRSTAAAAAAVAGVHDNAVHLGPFFGGPRESISAIVGGAGSPETMATSDLPSQVEIHRLEKALADMPDDIYHRGERQSLGYRLTRAKLIRGHMLGEI